MATEVFINQAEDQFAFAPRIGSDDDALGLIEEFFEDADLFLGSGVGFVRFAAFNFARFENKGFG